MNICLSTDIANSRIFHLSDALHLWFYWPLGQKLRGRGLQNASLDECISTDDCSRINLEAARIAWNWYKINGKDLTVFRNISLGSLCEYDLIIHINLVLRFTLAICRAMEKYSPLQVYHDAANNSDIARIINAISAHYRLKSNGLGSSNVRNILDYRFSTFSQVRRSFWSSLAAFVLNKIVLFKKPASRKPSILLHTKNPQITPVLREWLKRKSYHNLLIDLRSAPPSYLLRQILFRPDAHFIPAISLYRADVSRIIKNWQHAKLQMNDSFFLFEGVNIRNVIEPILNEVVNRRFSEYASAAEYYLCAFKENQVCAVVVNNDATPYQRLAVLVAKRRGVPSVVVQHGILGPFLDNDKKLADYSAVWSEFVKSQCTEKGIDSRKLIVTGAPAFDAYCSPRPSSVQPAKPEKILILTTNTALGIADAPLTYAEDFILAVMEVLKQLSLQKMIIKIHPSESEEYYKSLLANYRCTVIKYASLTELIAQCDLVICAVTTAALEARIMKKPIICLDTGKLQSPPSPFDGSSGIILVRDKKTLKMALEEFIRDPNNSYSDKFPIDNYIGPIDGKSAKRVYDFIENLCQKSGDRRSKN